MRGRKEGMRKGGEGQGDLLQGLRGIDAPKGMKRGASSRLLLHSVFVSPLSSNFRIQQCARR